MTLMKFTNHAIKRVQQRGFKKECITMLEDFGEIEYRPGGAFLIKIRKNTKNYLISQLKKQIKLIERASKKAIIVSADDFSAITAYHQKR